MKKPLPKVLPHAGNPGHFRDTAGNAEVMALPAGGPALAAEDTEFKMVNAFLVGDKE